jgi:hypothetical protein
MEGYCVQTGAKFEVPSDEESKKIYLDGGFWKCSCHKKKLVTDYPFVISSSFNEKVKSKRKPTIKVVPLEWIGDSIAYIPKTTIRFGMVCAFSKGYGAHLHISKKNKDFKTEIEGRNYIESEYQKFVKSLIV